MLECIVEVLLRQSDKTYFREDFDFSITFKGTSLMELQSDTL